MKYKMIIFDFDGTLADTEDINFTIYLDLADKYKLKKVSKDDMSSLKRLSALDLIDYLDIKKRNIPAMVRRGRKILHGSIENVDLCKPEMKNVLEELKEKGYILGILTSNSKKNVFKFIQNHQLDMFEFVYNTGVFGKENWFRKIMKKYQVTADQILYVGDEIRDITATKHVDIDIVAVDWGYNTRESLMEHHPLHLIDSPEALLEIVLNG